MFLQPYLENEKSNNKAVLAVDVPFSKFELC